MLFPIINPPNTYNTNSESNDEPNIPETDRVKFIKKCNKVDKELQTILSNHLSKLNQEQYHVLKEKREYVSSIRNIVNDLSFTNKKQFRELYRVLKEIQLDIKNQNKGVNQLEKTIAKDTQTKDELVNMLVQRMMYDSSRRTLKKPETLEILGLDRDEEQRKLLEKYIIKVIRKQLRKEMNKSTLESQDMDVVVNEQLKKKLDLIENTINKLGSMESLYEKIHSRNPEQRRRIITLVQEPVRKSIKPLKQCSITKETITPSIESIQPIKPINKPNNIYKANTIYVSE